MIGIIGAMEIEVASLKEKMTDITTTRKASMDFFRGNLSGTEVVVVRSGIGKVNAGICTQIMVDIFGVSYIINSGVAGSLMNEINIGDIVLSTDAVQHDVDASVFGYEPGQIPQMDDSFFKADKRLRELALECCKRVNPDINVFEGRVVSGDQFISSKEKKQWIYDTFSGACTEMEGAAIAQTAALNGVPFLIVRAISDKADDSATMNYDDFEEMAAKNSIKLMEALCKEL